MHKKALITGITGQDGSYLAELLLEKGYEVHGLTRRSSSFNCERLEQLPDVKARAGGVSLSQAVLHYGDLCDASSINRLLREIRPDEIYNLAAQSHVKLSFEIPEYTGDVNGLGPLRILEGVRESGSSPRIYQAGSSEVFGKVRESPQTETTPFYPRSPYAAAKVYAHWLTVNYREAYGMFICNGIAFNHESPRRGETFVSRKITLGAAAIKLGLQSKLALGNLEAQRDWGYAKDYVEAMWMMLQQDQPGDFVIASGETRSVRDSARRPSAAWTWTIAITWWSIRSSSGRPRSMGWWAIPARPAGARLGRRGPVFQELVRLMIDSDLELLKRQNR